MYSVSDNGNTETYMMPGTDLNPRLPSPVFENFEMMASDGSTEFVVDPSLYYPAASPYGYYCTGFESPGEWDERHTVFGLDGADVQYAGGQGENLPYVYYTPSYGFGDSPFNPYNPYIPGAMLGVDGSFVGTHPYYAVSPYASSSSGYVPVLVQPGSDTAASHTTDSRSDTAPSSVHRANGSAVKRTHSSSPATYSMNPSKAASSQTHAFTGTSQGSKINSGTSKRPMSSRNNGSNGSVHGASSHVPQGGNAPGTLHSTRNISYGKLLPETNQVKYSYPVGGGFSDYGSSTNSQAVFNDTFSKFYYRRPSDGNGNFDQLGEQNRGPRTNKSKNQFVVKAYTTRAGNRNAEGNIVISADQYNKEDFPVDYVHAKFFVIKSYSEDDVHKSIKYNVWSSTPNGNKKLSVAYEDAQKIATGKPRGCPIFLFFSVNASGQFCGVAEMVGPVDFDRDMDFWQQDKWSGSFPVKWHIIKDVPNPTFRHIILENNEHKPVTNSRDTQEIMHKQGLEMLKLFRNYSSKTSLLDDFMYYENRQKIMHEERTRLFRRANGHVHSIEGSLKLNHTNDHSQKADEAGTWVEKAAQPNPVGLKIASRSSEVSSSGGVHVSDVASKVLKSSEMQVGDVSSLKIGSLSINPRPIGLQSAAPASSSSSSAAMPKTVAMPKAANGQANGTANVVTVGSLPIKVDAANQSPEMLTIGTIALDPKALQHGKVGGFVKGGVQK